MNYLIKTVQPTTEPVTLAEAQLHLRLDTEGSPPSHPDDALLDVLISAARESVENYTGLTLVESQYQCRSTPVNSAVNLQTFPVLSVENVTYQDEDDETQIIDSDNYFIDNFKRPALLRFKRETPTKDVTVSFTAGFTDGDSPNFYPMPKPLNAAIKLIIGNLYQNRESVSDNQSYERPQSAINLMSQYRINMGL